MPICVYHKDRIANIVFTTKPEFVSFITICAILSRVQDI